MPDGSHPASRTRIGAAAGLAGATAVLALVVGIGPAPSVFQLAGAGEDVSGPCDEIEHAGDPECQDLSSSTTVDDGSSTSTTAGDGTSTTLDGSTSTSTTTGGAGDGGTPADGIRTLDAAGAGIVIYAVEDGRFRLVSATPAAGWQVDVEESAGRELDLDFRSGTRRVQVDVELEDGRVRERVRVRDDADGTDIRTEDGVVEADDSESSVGDDDRSGSDDEDRSGSNSGPG